MKPGFFAPWDKKTAITTYPDGLLSVELKKNPGRIKIVFHTGGVDEGRKGVPAVLFDVEADQSVGGIYMGGTMRNRGYREEFVCRDPQTDEWVQVDPSSGAPYGRKHDGFCGFWARQIWRGLNALGRGDDEEIGP